MYFCYLDESGTPETGSQTSHFVLVGLVIPAAAWLEKDRRIDTIKARYDVKGIEVHTGYMARRFPEQEKVSDLSELDHATRRVAVQAERDKELVRTAALKQPDRLKALKKLYRKTADYIHLTYGERLSLLRELADEIKGWQDARLLGNAADKRQFSQPVSSDEVFLRAFQNVVMKFNHFLENMKVGGTSLSSTDSYGLFIEDNNETVARKITEMVRQLHEQGCGVRDVSRIIETPLFVDSSLTSMVQMADLCAYATRRFFENEETDLFDRIFSRFEFKEPGYAGLFHFTGKIRCPCKVCDAGRATPTV